MIKSVLCVDDSSADQLIHKHRIRAHDASIDVRFANDGANALELLRDDYSPDLIFLDINMPGMNGFDFIEVYESEFDAESRCNIVVMSSSSDPRDRQWAESKDSIKGQMVKPLGTSWFEDVLAILGDAS